MGKWKMEKNKMKALKENKENKVTINGKVEEKIRYRQYKERNGK